MLFVLISKQVIGNGFLVNQRVAKQTTESGKCNACIDLNKWQQESICVMHSFLTSFSIIWPKVMIEILLLFKQS